MNDSEKYIADQIRLSIWSGHETPDRIQEIITEILEDDADEEMLRSLVQKGFDEKIQLEQQWPEITDCDKLENAFESLSEKGIVAIHNAGWDKGEGFHACLDAYREAGSPEGLFGICFYTSQDIESAIDGGGLYLGFGSTRADAEEADAPKAAELICKEVRAAGLSVDWNGTVATRINVDMKWQIRS